MKNVVKNINNLSFLSSGKRGYTIKRKRHFFRKTHPLSSDSATCFLAMVSSYFRSSFIPCHKLTSTVGMQVRRDLRNCIRPSNNLLEQKGQISKSRQVLILFTINQWPLIIEGQSIIQLKQNRRIQKIDISNGSMDSTAL